MPSKNRRIARLLALVVILAAGSVIAGWIFDIGVLKSLSPGWVSMKFDTAVAFFAGGLGLYFMSRSTAGEFDVSQVAILVTSFVILLLMGSMLLSPLFGINTGVESLFIEEAPEDVKTIVPGRPSLPTMLNFMLVAVAGIFSILNGTHWLARLKFIGTVVAGVGVLAVSGYAVNVPGMYYFIDGINGAMAFNTAVLFVLMGVGLVCLSD